MLCPRQTSPGGEWKDNPKWPRGKENRTNMTLGGYVTLREDETRAGKQEEYVLEEKGQKKLAGPNLR